MSRRRFVGDAREQLAFGHAFANCAATGGKFFSQLDKTGILRPNVDYKCRLDPDRAVNRRDRRAAADDGYFGHRHEKIIGHAANEDKQRNDDPPNPPGFRHLQGLQLMHIFGELEVTPGGAVPFRQGDVVKITRLQQSGLSFQMTAFGEAIFQL